MRTYLGLYNIINMWYSEGDWYEARQLETKNKMDDYLNHNGRDPYENREKDKMEIAKDIMSLLDNDQEVMDNFNFLLRQKKLKQLKNKK